MKVISLIENTSNNGLAVEHGLSLYIGKDDGQNVLFDMGQSGLFARNAEAMSLSVRDIDIAVVSHGHYDHGGGLGVFLSENQRARVYIHKDAFLPHYSLRDSGLRYIGLDKELSGNDRLTYCRGVTHIPDGMTLFAEVRGSCCNPAGNRLLFGPEKNVNDTFCHEQSLLVEENDNLILFAGCAHRGIVNIMHRAEEVAGKAPTHVLAGMHLVKSGLNEAEEDAFIGTLAEELMQYTQTKFYTMHCTGEEQYRKLRSLMNAQIEYLACGESLVIN